MSEHICDGQWRYYCEACSGLPEAGEKPVSDARREALQVWPHTRETEPEFYAAIGALGEHMAAWQKRQEDSNE